MVCRRIVLFLSLVVLCVAASSINLNQSTHLKYSEFQWMTENGAPAFAESGFRALAMKYPYTMAGIKSIRRLVSGGESLPRLMIEILDEGIKNTSPLEWFVFLSAFLVVSFFMAGNSLPSLTLPLFVISGAGIFHMSHPLISIQNDVLDTFLTVNPYLYTALTLLITGGYLHHRLRTAWHTAYYKSAAGLDLTPGEHLLMREIYLEKLKTLQERAKGLEGELKTPHGRHFVNELNRIVDRMENECRIIIGEMASSEAKYNKIIKDSEGAIDRAKEELSESKILLKSKAIDQNEFKRIRLEKESILKSCRRQISETNTMKQQIKKVHLKNRLKFRRRDLFLAYLHKTYIDKKISALKVVRGQGLFHPKIAKNDLKKQKIADRKRTAVDAKIARLEQRREKMTGLAYREKMKSLLRQKKARDRALSEVVDKIFTRMDLCKNKKERMEIGIQTLTAELEDMKALGRVRGFFPALVRVQHAKIRRAIKSGRKVLPDLHRIETIYKEVPSKVPGSI